MWNKILKKFKRSIDMELLEIEITKFYKHHHLSFKFRLSPPRKIIFICFIKSPLKMIQNDEKYFLFHLKSSFCSWDTCIFVVAFLIMLKKKTLIIKLRLISKFMTSQTTQHKYNTFITPYLKGKGNHTMRFSQLIEYIFRNIFLETSNTKCSG